MQTRILKFRHNVMGIFSISAFENIRGGINKDCKDVYFVRALGRNDTIENQVAQMDQALGTSMQTGRCCYRRISALPEMKSAGDTEYYQNSYSEWHKSGKTSAVTKRTEGQPDFCAVLGKACADVLVQWMSGAAANETAEKNFIIKILFWFDWITDGLLAQWNERLSVKIAAENITGKQEYLFFYFLTLLGFDVLLLQTQADLDADLKRLGLSKEFVLGEFGACVLPAGWQIENSERRPIRVDVRHPKREQKARQKAVQEAGLHSSETRSSSGRSQASSGRSSVMTSGSQWPSSSGVSGAGNRRPSSSGVSGAGSRRPSSSGSMRSSGVSGAPAGSLSGRRELSFEELAQLASSVVMIAIRDKKGEVMGTGSGIMVGEEGYILTNNHVTGGGYSYSVRIEDDENIYDTDELIKYNSVLDLAVIRIPRRLHPLPIYRGKEPLVRGQKVVAIGSPLGFFNSVSDGIISGFRTIDTVDMIQFTAPTSPGSSGGALLNMYGEVIGISTAGIESAQNINLAMGYECINMFVGGFTGCRKN